MPYGRSFSRYGRDWADGRAESYSALSSHRHEILARRMGEVLGKACW